VGRTKSESGDTGGLLRAVHPISTGVCSARNIPYRRRARTSFLLFFLKIFRMASRETVFSASINRARPPWPFFILHPGEIDPHQATDPLPRAIAAHALFNLKSDGRGTIFPPPCAIFGFAANGSEISMSTSDTKVQHHFHLRSMHRAIERHSTTTQGTVAAILDNVWRGVVRKGVSITVADDWNRMAGQERARRRLGFRAVSVRPTAAAGGRPAALCRRRLRRSDDRTPSPNRYAAEAANPSEKVREFLEPGPLPKWFRTGVRTLDGHGFFD